MDLALIALIIVVVTMVLMIIDIMPLGATLMLSCIAMQLTGILDITRVYADFGGTTVIFLIAMLIIGNGIFDVGLAQDIGNLLFKTKIVKNERLMIFVCTIIAVILSAFCSNSAVIAMFIPLVAATHVQSGGTIRQKNVLMAIGMACAVGGSITLSGSTSQVVGQGLLEEAGVRTMTYFEMGKVAFPALIVVAIYMSTIGYRILDKHVKIDDSIDPELLPKEGEHYPKWKKWLVGVVTVLVLLGFVTGTWNIAYCALCGAAVLLATKTLDWKKSFKAVDWNTVCVLGFATAMAAGMNSSGAGKMIADWILNLCGGETASVTMIMVVMSLLCLVLTNVMSNTATVAMLAPIAINMALNMGVEPLVFVCPIAVASGFAIATPIGTPCMTQAMVAGYRFKDYLVVGLPLTVLLGVVLAVLSPIMYL